MKWHLKRFDELSNEKLYQLLKLRSDVFVVEQDCVYPDLDNVDQEALHLFLEMDGEVVALIRLLPPGVMFRQASIGRVAVAKKHRGKGYARQMMERGITFILDEWEADEILIHAQSYLQPFYESLGFKQVSESYIMDQLPHMDMLLRADRQRMG